MYGERQTDIETGRERERVARDRQGERESVWRETDR